VKIAFLVQGSQADPYRVIFSRNGSDLTAHCSCAAGLVGQPCKHRLNILRGEMNEIVSGNADEVASVAELLAGSPLEHLLNDLTTAETEEAETKKRIKAIKKQLGRVMNG